MTTKQEVFDLEADTINEYLNDCDFEAAAIGDELGALRSALGGMFGTGETVSEMEAEEIRDYATNIEDRVYAILALVSQIVDSIQIRDEPDEED